MKQYLKEMKAKALPLWLRLLGRLGINSAKTALEKRLPDGPTQDLVMAIAEPMVATIDEFGDNEPENPIKVRALWLRWLHSFMIPWLFRLFQPVIDRIKAEYNKKMLQYVKDFAQSISGFLTDEIKPDGAQIDQFIDSETAKPETKHLVIREFGGGNLANAGLNADLIAFFIEAAEIGWDAIVNKSQALALGVLTEELEDVTIITLPSGRVGTFTRVAA